MPGGTASRPSLGAGRVAGYLLLTAHERLVARIQCALHLQVTTQARINATAMLTNEWWDLCEWERRILNGPRHLAPNLPDGFPTRNLFDGLDVWTASTPLVCVTTASEPLVQDVPAIVGTLDNLLIIDPVDDWHLLASLEDIGLVQTFRHTG